MVISICSEDHKLKIRKQIVFKVFINECSMYIDAEWSFESVVYFLYQLIFFLYHSAGYESIKL